MKHVIIRCAIIRNPTLLCQFFTIIRHRSLLMLSLSKHRSMSEATEWRCFRGNDNAREVANPRIPSILWCRDTAMNRHQSLPSATRRGKLPIPLPPANPPRPVGYPSVGGDRFGCCVGTVFVARGPQELQHTWSRKPKTSENTTMLDECRELVLGLFHKWIPVWKNRFKFLSRA